MKRKTIIFVAALLIVYFLFTFFAPGIVDRKKNATFQKPPYDVSQKAQEVYHSLDFIADMHCDVLLWDRNILKKHDYGQVDIPRMLSANIGLQAFTIVTKTPRNLNFDKNTGETDNISLLMFAQRQPLNVLLSLKERALMQCESLKNFAKKSKGKFTVIESREDFQNYLSKRKNQPNITAGFLGIEGAHALEGDLKNIDVLYDAGVRMIGLTHFFDNKLGGSAHGVSHGGLTAFGKQAVTKMQSKNIIIDVAHASPKMIDDILAMTTKPIVCSHTGVKGICDNVRNMSDKHIKAIAKTNGLISIAMFQQAVCDTKIKGTAKSIKYVIDLVGADYVALGSDFDGAAHTSIDVTGFPLIVQELLALGVSKSDIAKVMGGNVKRFMLENLPGKSN